jgi:hypothetical protein
MANCAEKEEYLNQKKIEANFAKGHFEDSFCFFDNGRSALPCDAVSYNDFVLWVHSCPFSYANAAGEAWDVTWCRFYETFSVEICGQNLKMAHCKFVHLVFMALWLFYINPRIGCKFVRYFFTIVFWFNFVHSSRV